MKEGFIKDTYELILKEIQSILTVAYLLMVGIGMLFNYQKYAEFGINIFEYADVFDFLIAPFEDRDIIYFAFLSMVIPFFLFRLDYYWKKKAPRSYSRWNFGWDKKPWYNVFRYLVFAGILIFYLYLAADSYGKNSRKKTEAQAPVELRFSDGEVKTGILIGKTQEVLFFLSGEKVSIIPLTSQVKEYEVQ